MTGYGGSVRNGSTRSFEARHQIPKRTLTNMKDGHLQQVRRQNLIQAMQLMARGESWDAYYVNPDGIVETVKVKAGPKLQKLLQHYPKLCPHASSIAATKGHQSTIVMRDDSLYLNLHVSYKNVECVPRVGAAGVKIHEGEARGANEHRKYLLSRPMIDGARDLFQKGKFPEPDWFESGHLRAFPQMRVYRRGAETATDQPDMATEVELLLTINGMVPSAAGVKPKLPSRVRIEFQSRYVLAHVLTLWWYVLQQFNVLSWMAAKARWKKAMQRCWRSYAIPSRTRTARTSRTRTRTKMTLYAIRAAGSLKTRRSR